jgi:outer membrane cobalamin receptor
MVRAIGLGLAAAVCIGAVGSCLAADDGPTISQVTVTGEAPRVEAPIAATGEASYAVTADDIASLPSAGALTDVLLQAPSVSLDQNQQIHIRDTEGPQFQYQINGVLIPLDINTNPPFLSMIGPDFIQSLNLRVGVLPARYSYATGGVLDIQTKDGCTAPGGQVSLLVGMRQTIEGSGQAGGCTGKLSWFVSGSGGASETAFSQATPGPKPIHDHGDHGQGFGFFSYKLSDTTKVSLILSGSASDNQLPNQAGLAPQFVVAGAATPPSADIDSRLNFRDALAILALNSQPTANFSWQLAYAFHSIRQVFVPDVVGELAYQGVASHAVHQDTDHTLQGDVTWTRHAHTLSAGFYAGLYHVDAVDRSLVFPVDPDSGAVGTTPVEVDSVVDGDNVVAGLYLNDLWQISPAVSLNLGLRWDSVTGATHGNQLDPTVNLTWRADKATTLHAGVARYFQVPSWQGLSPAAQAAFENTTAAGPPGIAAPLTEDDVEIDAGLTHRFGPRLTASLDAYYEWTRHYLDTGQFGSVPIFAPFNYGRGRMWGMELAVNYRGPALSAWANLTLGRNTQQGVATGQFNFDPDELAYIGAHAIVLDHQPLVGVSAGAAWTWRGWTLGADALYSSGLRSGFADIEQLPPVFQVNASVTRRYRLPGGRWLTNKVSVLNLFDRTNLIRPAEGIGIFQAAYGPRLAVYDQISIGF